MSILLTLPLSLTTPAQAVVGAITEVDEFPNSEARITLGIAGQLVDVSLSGPTEVHVFFEGPEGVADDDDGDGLDEVETEIVSMELTGDSPLGPIIVRQSSLQRSLGEIEEIEDKTSGILDVPPFGSPGDTADSFFDVFFEIEVGGQTLFNSRPASMAAVIEHKPPECNATYRSTHQPIELLDIATGEPTGIFMIAETHTPRPCDSEEPPVEVGGEVYPVNQLAVLAPWIALVAVLILGTILAVNRRRIRS